MPELSSPREAARQAAHEFVHPNKPGWVATHDVKCIEAGETADAAIDAYLAALTPDATLDAAAEKAIVECLESLTPRNIWEEGERELHKQLLIQELEAAAPILATEGAGLREALRKCHDAAHDTGLSEEQFVQRVHDAAHRYVDARASATREGASDE